MPYILYKSNGTKLITLADGSVDKNSADITFVGKNYAGYGEILNQNLVKLLENFANTSAPSKPLVGQLWYDTGAKNLKVYTGNRFKGLQNFDIGSSAPRDNVQGDLFFNSFEKRLYLYDGTRFLLIGPQDSQFSGISVVSTLVTDIDANNKYIMKFSIADDNGKTIPAVVSKDTFEPNPLDDLISENFSWLQAGITLPGADKTTGQSVTNGTGYYFWGTAKHAERLGDHDASEFALLVDLEGQINNGLTIPHDNGVLVGAGQIFRFHSDTAQSEGKISAVAGSKISFNLIDSNALTLKNVITIDQRTIVPNTTWGIDIGTIAKPFDRVYVNTLTSTEVRSINIYGPLTGNVTGNTTGLHTGNVVGNVTGTLTGNANSPVVTTPSIQATGGAENSVGTIKGAWSLVGSSTLKATYADLAERYHADQPYDYGTVVVLGEPKEITVCTKRADTAVAGVISHNPAYMLNSDAGDDKTHPYVALTGRVPCKVTGIIHKGDLLVSSTMVGHAELFQAGDNPAAVVGKALENFSGHSGVIEIKV